MSLDKSFCVADHVECLREVNCHGYRAVRGTLLIEATDYIMNERKERRDGRMI